MFFNVNHSIINNEDDLMNKYMKIANEQALKGINNQEGGPFGAIIIDQNDKIVGIGNNQVLKEKDPTLHAEIVAIKNACKTLDTHDLSGCTIYTSCEPCPMCLSAIIWANIKTAYYGCTKKDAADIGFRDDDIYEFIKGQNQMINLKQLDREECLDVMKKYKGKMY